MRRAQVKRPDVWFEDREQGVGVGEQQTWGISVPDIRRQPLNMRRVNLLNVCTAFHSRSG